ncbi:MAG TPA: hypothetical protein VHE83_07065 [Mycobacteriales bacterium]|nr:hypothetical protein [Mycobacteriales bacterium]
MSQTRASAPIKNTPTTAVTIQSPEAMPAIVNAEKITTRPQAIVRRHRQTNATRSSSVRDTRQGSHNPLAPDVPFARRGQDGAVGFRRLWAMPSRREEGAFPSTGLQRWAVGLLALLIWLLPVASLCLVVAVASGVTAVALPVLLLAPVLVGYIVVASGMVIESLFRREPLDRTSRLLWRSAVDHIRGRA